jgi:hypothetical protein
VTDEPDPLHVLLRSARSIGEEFCWPAADILTVIWALESLDRLVLGAELWTFAEVAAPTVLGWTTYEVTAGSWQERVAESSRLAAEDLRKHSEDPDAWVNLTWAGRDDGVA